jgi:hypothetical protein
MSRGCSHEPIVDEIAKAEQVRIAEPVGLENKRDDGNAEADPDEDLAQRDPQLR